MTRGKNAEVGNTYVSANGYHYTRAKDGYRLTHHILAEEILGRELRHNEMVRFIDKDKTNLKKSNIQIIEKGTSSLRRRAAVIEARIDELKAELDEINREIKKL